MSVGAIETVEKPTPTTDIDTSKETKDYYAWANIDFGADKTEEGYITKRHIAKYGDKVTQKDLGLDDEEWKKLVEEDRVIRKRIPPETKQYESPKRKMIADAKKAMEIAIAGGE